MADRGWGGAVRQLAPTLNGVRGLIRGQQPEGGAMSSWPACPAKLQCKGPNCSARGQSGLGEKSGYRKLASWPCPLLGWGMWSGAGQLRRGAEGLLWWGRLASLLATVGIIAMGHYDCHGSYSH